MSRIIEVLPRIESEGRDFQDFATCEPRTGTPSPFPSLLICPVPNLTATETSDLFHSTELSKGKKCKMSL
jgi:hypothetical protein